MEDEPQIRCPIFLEEEKKIKKITDEINKAEPFGKKAERSKDLVEEAEKLLACEKYDDKSMDCKSCRMISKVRKSTGKLISEPKEVVAEITKGLGNVDLSLGTLSKGLGGFMDLVSDMMEEGVTEVRRGGEISGLGKRVHGMYGFKVSTMPGGKHGGGKHSRGLKRTTICHRKRIDCSKITDSEPLIEVFEEGDHVNVIAEIPGLSEAEIKTKVKDGVLSISTDSKDKKYTKEIPLPELTDSKPVKKSYKNGILKLKFKKKR